MKTSSQNSGRPDAKSAMERAQSANTFAKEARTHRDQRDSLVDSLAAWEQIMIDCPVVLLTMSFFILAVVEIVISWTMYGDLQSSILSRPNPLLSIFMGMMVVSIGAVVSHYVSKRLSSSLFELEVFNLRYRNENSMALAVAEEKVRIKTRKHFRIGLVLFTILIIGVLAISFQRVGLMSAISGKSFGLLSKLLPVIIVILEVFCGIYLGYFFRRISAKRQIVKLNKSFNKSKTACAYETHMCQECYQHSMNKGDNINYNRELRDTLYRYDRRTQDNDNYVDEIPEVKNLNMLIMNDGQIVSGVQLFGLLPDNNFTNSIWTNNQGQAVLEWQTNHDCLESLMIDRIEYPGPFKAFSSIKIDIDMPKMLKAAV